MLYEQSRVWGCLFWLFGVQRHVNTERSICANFGRVKPTNETQRIEGVQDLKQLNKNYYLENQIRNPSIYDWD